MLDQLTTIQIYIGRSRREVNPTPWVKLEVILAQRKTLNVQDLSIFMENALDTQVPAHVMEMERVLGSIQFRAMHTFDLGPKYHVRGFPASGPWMSEIDSIRRYC